jgi:hypothetical protein
MRTIRDPELARLIREYRAAECAADEAEIASSLADRRLSGAQEDLTKALVARNGDDDDAIRSVHFEGCTYYLDYRVEPGKPNVLANSRPFARYERPARLID